jgi:hypothetical protein
VAKVTTTDMTQLTTNESNAMTRINNNLAALETALENTLSRDGTAPNQMEADLDMNSNDLLNVKDLDATSIDAGSLSIGGVEVGVTLYEQPTNAISTMTSIANLRLATDVTLTTNFVNVASWYANLNEGGGLFVYDSSDTTSADNSGTIIVDASNRRWKRQDDDGELSLLMFGAKGDGTTDDTAAIQAAFTYAASLCTDASYFQSRRVVLTGGGKRYLVSSPLTLSSVSMSLRNCQFLASDASANWTDNNAVLTLGGESMHIENIEIDGDQVANGILHTATDNYYTNVNIKAFRNETLGFGFKSVSGGPVYAFKLQCFGWPSALGTDQADRKGYGIWMEGNGDSKFVSCVAAYCGVPLLNKDVTDNIFIGCHFYNGSGDDLVQHTDPIIVENRNAAVIFNGCYFDNGYVDLYDQDAIFSGCFFLNTVAKALITARVRLWASTASDTLTRLQFEGNYFNSASIPVFEFNATGGNSWAASVYTTAMESPTRDVQVGYAAREFITTNPSENTAARFSTNSATTRVRIASNATTDGTEPLLETTGSDLRFKLGTGTEWARFTSGGNLLIGVTSATSNGAKIETLDGLTFPSVAVSKSNANTLDAYAEGSWTPTITFATAGDLAVTYATQIGRYTRIGNRVFYSIQITTSAFTHTTASGAFRVNNLPFTSKATSGASVAACAFRGYTKANYTMVVASAIGGTTNLQFIASGSGQSTATLASGDIPTGGTIDINISGHFEVDT